MSEWGEPVWVVTDAADGPEPPREALEALAQARALARSWQGGVRVALFAAAAALFAFIVSFDNVGISIFLVGPRFDVLPVSLYAYAAYNNDPLASAVSVVLILGAVAAVAVLERVFGLQRLLQA